MMRFLKHNLRLLGGLLLLILIVGGLAYVVFGLGDRGDDRRQETINIIATADIPAEGQPVVPLAPISPALLDALMNREPFVQDGNDRFLPAEIPPIGIYVPRIGEDGVQFELRPDLQLEPPANLDNSLLDANGLPIASEAVGEVELLEFAGEGCAPAGLPASGILTQRYHRFHSGIDVGVPLGTAVQATHSGEVVFAGWSSYGYGYVVILQNGRYITYYAHLTNFNVQNGDEIGAGSVVGWSGSTGNSTGPHIHYETRIDDIPVDPLTFETRGLGTC